MFMTWKRHLYELPVMEFMTEALGPGKLGELLELISRVGVVATS